MTDSLPTPCRNRASPAALLWWRFCLALLIGGLVLAPWWIHRHQTETLPGVLRPLPEDPVQARKARLINALLPLIQDSNRRILERRAYAEALLEKVRGGETLDRKDAQWLESMAKRYRLEPDQDWDETRLGLLLRRIDVIPADLALAQAALESGWGESRFAREGNNYFGHWCFEPGCGLVPEGRPEGARYEVASFDSPRDSVRRYMRNLNAHPRYTRLRLKRESLRAAGEPVIGVDLAEGLDGYSTTGEVYVRTVQALIRSNGLDRFASH